MHVEDKNDTSDYNHKFDSESLEII